MGPVVNDHIFMLLFSPCIMVYGLRFGGDLWFRSGERVSDFSNGINEALLIQ